MGRKQSDSGEGEAKGQRLFDRLYSAHAPRVRGHLLRLTNGDQAEAEDLTQETFIAAYAGRRTFRAESRPLTYLIGIARRRWRDAQRRFRPDTEILSETLPDVSDTANIETAVLRADALERALAALDPPARNAVLMVLGKGLTYAEAAALLGEPVGTVKWRVHEATRLLRRLLSEENEEKK